jgi:SAM-dependent methyltransferase
MQASGGSRELEDLSARRESFSLREYREVVSPESDPVTFLTGLLPDLSRLRLSWRRDSGDFLIFRHPPTDPFVPGKKDLREAESRLAGGGIPEDFQRLMEEYIEKKTGKPWNDPTTLQRIRASVMQQKSQYWKEGEKRKIGYRKGYAVLGYLAYHAPVTLVQFQYLYLKLLSEHLIPRQARILDAGTGPGIVPLAISDLLRNLPGSSADIYAIERSEEFIEAFCSLVPAFPQIPDTVTIHRPVRGDLTDAGALLLPSSLDLIVMQNVLNELPGDTGAKARVIESLSRLLTPEGCLVVLEPADLDNSTNLRRVVNAALGKDLMIRDPCRLLRSGRCLQGSCWSFMEKPSIRPTRLMRALSGNQEAYRFENTDIKFSYAVLVRDRKKLCSYTIPRDAPVLPLSSLRHHENRRVNLTAAVMSGDIGDSKNHVFLVCDGTATAYAILPRYHVTPDNKALLSAPYSSVYQFRQVLVRYNRKHKAFNLFLSRNSMVREILRIHPASQEADPEPSGFGLQ